jgi:uncharacterized membrane protein
MIVPREGVRTMATIEKSIAIEALPEHVAEYLADPVHLPEIWPSMIEVRDVEALPAGGNRYHWVYKMAGMRFEGDSETVEFVPNEHFVQKNTGIPSTFFWKFLPKNGGTEVEMKVDYEVPKTLLGKFAEPFVLRLNEREAEIVLANLKDRVES